jgi:hypothetical protein
VYVARARRCSCYVTQCFPRPDPARMYSSAVDTARPRSPRRVITRRKRVTPEKEESRRKVKPDATASVAFLPSPFLPPFFLASPFHTV